MEESRTVTCDRRFDDFYVFDYPKLVSALRLVTGDDDAARDAVDEACARAWERLIGTVIRGVQLTRGVYALHCIVPGNTEAAEEMLLDVG